LLPDFLLGLFFHFQDWGDMFLWIVWWLSPDYILLDPIWRYSSHLKRTMTSWKRTNEHIYFFKVHFSSSFKNAIMMNPQRSSDWGSHSDDY
jgi:hypothetical protein